MRCVSVDCYAIVCCMQPVTNHILYINPEFRSAFGYEFDELSKMGADWMTSALFNGLPTNEEHRRRILHALNAQIECSLATNVLTKNGWLISIKLYISLSYSPSRV